MKKRILSLALASAMAVGTVGGAFAETEVVAEVKTSPQYINGYEDGTFRSVSHVSRAEIAKMVAILQGLEETEENFDDVPDTHWAAGFIGAVQEAGIVEGDELGNFNPTAGLTRAELATIVSRVIEDSEGEGTEFSDVEGHWAADAIAKVSAAGIINGYPDGSFKPNDKVTRAESVKMLNAGLLGMLEIEDGTVSDVVENPFSDELGWAAEHILAASTEFEYALEDGKLVDVMVAAKVESVSVATDEDVATVSAVVKNAEEGAKATVEIFANGDTSVDAVVSEEVEIVDGAVSKEIAGLPAGDHVARVTVGESSVDADFTITISELAVQSVSAINAAQFEIRFNKAVDKDSVINSAGADDVLASNFITFTQISGTGTLPVANTTSLASLSADGRTLKVTLASGQLHNQTLTVKVAKDVVKSSVDSELMGEYVSGLIQVKDEVNPAVSSVERRNAATMRVYFSEPLANEGSWTFKLSNGNSTSDVTADVSNIKKGYIDLTLGASIDVGEEVTATVIGARDYAGNLIAPNPDTVKITKGAKDGVKPTVASLKALSLSKFEIKFSEEVQGFTVEDVKVGGTALVAGTDTLTQDKDDKTKYTVELNAALLAGLHTISIDASALTDLSGELNDAFSRVIEFKADTTAPKLVKSEIKTDVGVEYLHVTFDESVDIDASASTLAAKQLKDFVTTTSTVDLSGLTVVPNTDKKEYKVALKDVTFNGVALSKDAVYTVTMDGAFDDLASNALGKSEISFTRGSDTTSSKPEIDESVGGNGIVVIDNDTLQVNFDRELDGASATNVNNYSINGVIVEKATLMPGNIVELEIKEDSNTLSGNRTVTISGVKSKSGVMMDTFTTFENLTENVRPTVTAASLTSTTEITLTFSEAMDAATISAVDGVEFAVEYGTTTYTGTVTAAAHGTDNKKVVITLGTGLTVDQLNAGLKVKTGTAFDITDANGNKANFTSVAVQQ